jgi:tissue factor pathway inhibitor 2
VDPGKCENNEAFQNISRFYYDMNKQKCEGFEYTGCGGNKNNFETLSDCETACM